VTEWTLAMIWTLWPLVTVARAIARAIELVAIELARAIQLV